MKCQYQKKKIAIWEGGTESNIFHSPVSPLVLRIKMVKKGNRGDGRYQHHIDKLGRLRIVDAWDKNEIYVFVKYIC